MGKINVARVVIGGLVAGLVYNVGEYVLNEIVLGDQWDAAAAAIGIEVEINFLYMVILWFLVGLMSVKIYAAYRPRFGAGPGTAVKAAITVWFLIWFFGYMFNLALPMWPNAAMGTALVWGLVESIVATMAGAAIYSE